MQHRINPSFAMVVVVVVVVVGWGGVTGDALNDPNFSLLYKPIGTARVANLRAPTVPINQGDELCSLT